MTWKAWTEHDVNRLLRAEIAGLDPASAERFQSIQCRPFLLAWPRLAAFGKEGPDEDSTWAVAKVAQDVLFFDTVEEEFGLGRIEGEKRLTGYGTYGERLAWSLQHFPGQSAPVANEGLVVDHDLGPLEWDEDLDWWEGEILLGSNQPFVLHILSRKDDRRPITDEARAAIARIRASEAACRRYAADELLAIHNSEWSEGTSISADEFVARLSPDSVEVHEGGYVEVHFKDGGLFRGHSVGVRIEPEGAFQDAVVEG